LMSNVSPPRTQAMEGNAPTDSKALAKLERVAIEMEEAATCVARLFARRPPNPAPPEREGLRLPALPSRLAGIAVSGNERVREDEAQLVRNVGGRSAEEASPRDMMRRRKDARF